MKKFLLVPPFPRWNGYINHKFKKNSINKINSCLHSKQGSMALFPAMWNWLHKGNPVKNKPKYIVGTMMHYV